MTKVNLTGELRVPMSGCLFSLATTQLTTGRSLLIRINSSVEYRRVLRSNVGVAISDMWYSVLGQSACPSSALDAPARRSIGRRVDMDIYLEQSNACSKRRRSESEADKQNANCSRDQLAIWDVDLFSSSRSTSWDCW
jgi:hypothetical protein